MTIKELKELLANASDNDHIVVVNGKITLIKNEPAEYKFKVGDKVRHTIVPTFRYTVKARCSTEGQATYMLETEFGETALSEEYLELIPQDITERIKTIDDALRWCMDNDRKDLLPGHHELNEYLKDMPDVIAYLKLRVITAALNEGWEPKFDKGEKRWFVEYDIERQEWEADFEYAYTSYSPKLLFKSQELALYAAKQFSELYADFCGVKKGDEE